MKYNKEKIKDAVFQLVDMMDDYKGHKMSFEVDPESVFPVRVTFYRSSDNNYLSYRFYHDLSLLLNMEGLKEWMEDNDLV